MAQMRERVWGHLAAGTFTSAFIFLRIEPQDHFTSI